MKRHTLAAERIERVLGDQAERKLTYDFAKQFAQNDKAALADIKGLRSLIDANYYEFTEARRNVIRDRNFIGRFKWLLFGR